MKQAQQFSRYFVYLAFCLLVMQVATAQAAMREFKLLGANGPDCYSGKFMLYCNLGVRGDWLDITDKVTIVSGPTATITISDKGADNKYSPGALGSYMSVPPMRGDREGYILLKLNNISGPGTMRIKMERTGFMGNGRDADYVNINILDGTFGLTPEQTIKDPEGRYRSTIKTGQKEVRTITGYGLSGVSVKPGFSSQPTSNTSANPQRVKSVGQINASVKDSVGQVVTTTQANMQLPPEVKILSRETGLFEDKLTVEFNLRDSDHDAQLNTADIFIFSKGVPPINSRLGWPIISTFAMCGSSAGCSSRSSSGGSRNGSTGGGTTNAGNTGGGVRTAAPAELNLLPNINTPTVFIRQINTGNPILLDRALCNGLIKQQEATVNVPPITWMVTNASDVNINQPFSVSLINGSNPNPPFHTVTVNNIPAGGLVSFNNWPGRPTQIKVKLTPDPRQPNNNDANQCLLTDTRPVNTLFDPRPLTIRVDSNNQVNEGSRENDNDLTVNP